MQLFVIALRRSGTTTFWKAFRQDSRFVGYNEPFNPGAINVTDPDWVNLITYSELRELYLADPGEFMRRFHAIYGVEELREGLTGGQRSYLTWLLESEPNVAIDFTRCYFKLDALHELAPDAVVVHLYRPPEAWVTSILLHTGFADRLPDPLSRARRRLEIRLKNAWVRRTFWSHNTEPSMGFRDLIGTPLTSPFAELLPSVGLDPEEVFRMPTVGRLLAYWKLAYSTVEARGRALFGSRFLSLGFYDFCRSPQAAIRQTYEMLGLDPPRLDKRYVQAPKSPFQPDNIRWQEYRQRLALPHLT